LRTAYLGTSEFAVAVLRHLVASAHRPELVITRPDRPRGRGRHPAPPPVAVAARELGIELAQPESVNDEATLGRLARLAPEAICVSAYGALIKEPLLSGYLMLNVHPSLLPRWRGAAPIERAIMAGDAETGVSIMRVTAGWDSGPVCGQERDPITPSDTYGSLAARLQELGGQLLVRVLDERLECAEQDESLVTYAEKIAPQDRRLDAERPAVDLERLVRALHPHIGAWVELPEVGRLGVLEARAVPSGGGRPGRLVTSGGRPAIECVEGELQLITVKPPGRRGMSGEDWLRGRRR
jgi:methionyl-tRNA formyltransferase